MSSRQVEEFGTLFAQGESLQLFQSAMDGGLRQCSIRGVAWRFFLGTLSGPPEGWRAALDRQQVDYDVLCARHCVDPSELADQVGDEVDLSVVNPLSVDEANPYAQYFASSALREQIDQDLFRLHPGNEFFARPEVRRVMRRILYVWASAHPELSYRQGMHELIAPLVSVIWHEAEEAVDRLRTHARQTLKPLTKTFGALPRPDHTVGSSKAIRSLAKLVGYPMPGWSGSERMMLPRAALGSWIPRLARIPASARQELPGITADRTFQIVAGAVVLHEAMRAMDVEELEVSPWALREGVLLRYIESMGWG